MANEVTIQSRLLGAQMATRSPDSTPLAISARATSVTAPARAPKLTRRSLSTTASKSPYRSAAAYRTEGIVAPSVSVIPVMDASPRPAGPVPHGERTGSADRDRVDRAAGRAGDRKRRHAEEGLVAVIGGEVVEVEMLEQGDAELHQQFDVNTQEAV